MAPRWFRLQNDRWTPTGPWDPQVGDVVCDCFYRHLRIVWIDKENDQIELEDGSYHSLPFCCDPSDHTWSHPEPATGTKREQS